MSYESWKWIALFGWLSIVAAVGAWAGVTSAGAFAALAAFGLVPPCALWFLWRPPLQTLTERIVEARR